MMMEFPPEGNKFLLVKDSHRSRPRFSTVGCGGRGSGVVLGIPAAIQATTTKKKKQSNHGTTLSPAGQPMARMVVVVNGHSVVWFFLGSVLGLIAAMWDFCDAMMIHGDAAVTGGKDVDETETALAMERSLITAADNAGWSWWLFSNDWSTTYLYQSLVLLAPLCYLVEAIVEISSKSSRNTTNTSHNRRRHRNGGGDDDDNTMIMILQRWNDLFFAVGAICELSGTMILTLLVSNNNNNNMTTAIIAPIFSLLSTHAYCVNGMVALWQQDHRQQCCIGRRYTSSNDNDSNDALLYSGDVLFGAGATLDLILSYIACFSSLDRRKSGNIATSTVNLISAICWCANAVLYLIVWQRQQQQRHILPSRRRRRRRPRRFDPNHNDDNDDALLVVDEDDDAVMDDHDNENNHEDDDNNDVMDTNNDDLETPLLLHHGPLQQPPPQHDSTPTPPPGAVVVDNDDYHHHHQGGDHYSSSSQTTTESGGSIMRNRRAAAAAAAAKTNTTVTTNAPPLLGTGADPNHHGSGGNGDRGDRAWHNNNSSPPRWIRERPHLV
jgi:hypothetical protein